MTEAVEDSPRHETDVLLPDNQFVTLRSGRELEIVPLRSREFFKLMRIITRGGAMAITRMVTLAAMDSSDVFAGQLIGLVVFAIPEAPEETLDFVRSMVVWPPQQVGSEPNPEWLSLAAELDNPDPEDLISIISAVITREKDDLASLGKRLLDSIRLMVRMGQVNESQSPTSSEATLKPSTSSPASTVGTMTPSSTSPSRVRAKSPRR